MIFAPPDWQLISLALAACAAGAFTPGPNNAICMSTAVNFGFRRALPFALGVTFGFPILVLATGAGIGRLLSYLPQLHSALKIGGALFLLYLAWRIATARAADGGKMRAPGFFHALAFQWINPKAITYAFSIVAVFARPGDLWTSDIFYLAIVSMVVALGSTFTWAAFGLGIRRFLKTPRALAWFNGIMGALLAFTAVLIFFV